MRNLKNNLFKVIATENSDSADILLYGIIGQDFWFDKDLKEESLTDIEFAKTFRELERKYKRINIRINSPGGSFHHGNAIVSMILGSKAEIHTYIDGTAASMAADIWLSAPNRHMSINSMLMIHSALGGTWGNAKEHRKTADLLDKYSLTQVMTTAKATGLEEEEVKKKYYDNYEDHFFTAQEAKEAGFIEEVEDYKVENKIEDIEKMTFTEIMKHFEERGDEEHIGFMELVKKNLFAPIQKLIQPTKTTINHQSNIDMKIEDFKQSFDTEELPISEVQKVLEEKGFKVTKKVEETPATPEPQPDITKIVEAAVEKAVKPLNEKIEAQAQEIEKLGKRPGESITLPNGQQDTPDGITMNPDKQLEEDLTEMAEAANNWQNPFSKQH